jgi:diguanylate cyclase (GGDEF)-like protein
MIDAPFGNCKTADLQHGNQVQSFAGLVVIDKRTQHICACSANIKDFIDRAPAELLGQPWNTVFSADQLISLFKPADAPGQQFAHIEKLAVHERTMLIASHSVDAVTLVEMEPYLGDPHSFDFADRVGYLQALAATDTPESAANVLMTAVAGVNQYDRVMLYKFLPEWHGEVIAECLKPGVPGYLGLRFPAADLPANVRRLYVVNWQRLIADVEAQPVEVIRVPDCPTIDYSFSQIRAVHPVHIQYLKNLGVEASFSVSVMVGARLWGLVVCHNLTPKTVSLDRRQRCEELARTTGIHMAAMLDLQTERERAALRANVAAILGALRAENENKRSIVSQLLKIRQTFRAQGILAHLDDQDFHGGDIPDDVSLSALRNSLETADKSSIAARRSIIPSLAKYPALIRFASGTLLIPLTGQDFLLLMRPEQIEKVTWAGKPQGYLDDGKEIGRLTPRASFQAWSEQVKGTSEPWEDVEIEAAAEMRDVLIEYIDRCQLETLALRDPLTGLANRLMFEHALQEAIKYAIKDNMLAAVFMLDLDRFKAVNDTWGHAAGDELLIQVAGRLTAQMRARDTVARLGGDEFGIVGFDLRQAEDADRTAARIIADIRRPFTVHGHQVEVGVSIGVSMCPIHATEQGELLENADLALYEAKGAGRNTFKAFTNSMLSDADQKESVRHGLTDAMRDGALFLAYQPIVSAKTGALQSFEAFARWQHPFRGELAARDFLPLVEQCQLLTPFAEWGIRRVLQQGKTWMSKALPLVPVSLNLSARQFLSLDLAGVCDSMSRELDIGLEWLRFDVEETVLQADFPRAADKIAALFKLGILINIDHFGQGLVPLNQMCDVKFNQLKITNKYFEAGPAMNRNDALIAIIHQVGRVLRVPIVATQIETEAMKLRALGAGIDCLQGYLISRPLTVDAAEAWLANRNGSEGPTATPGTSTA